MRFATLVDKKRGVRDDIKYTRTSLKIVRLGIARTHGWVELVPTAPTSSSHRSSTVYQNYNLASRLYPGFTVHLDGQICQHCDP